MKKVLIISTSYDEQKMIEEVASQQQSVSFQIETTGSFGQKPEWWAQQAPDVVLIKLPSDEFLQNFFFAKLKTDIPKTVSLLFICDSISAALMQMTTLFQKVRILKSPIESFDLFRALNELLADYEPGRQQASPRYMTNQAIIVSSDFKTGKLDALMKNLSISGAFFESKDNSMGLANGDLIRIQIIIPGMKEYVFDAKIVWVRANQPGQANGFGCTFIDKNEVYNNLLKGI